MNDENVIKTLESLAKISQQIQSIRDDIAKLDKSYKNKEMFPPRGTSDLKELYTALAKAQSEMPVAELNKENPYFKSKYADLQSVVQASRPPLTKNGLAVYQELLYTEDGQTILHTVLTHNSGQYIESRMRIVPPKNDIQTISSYTTYVKRIAYSSLVGVVTGEEDDDGEIAVATSRDTFAKGTALNRKYNPKEQTYETITKEQLEEMEYELEQYPDMAEQVLDGLRIQSIADMPKSKFIAAITRIREMKRSRNEGQTKKTNN